MSLSNIFILLKKEWITEIRKKSTLASVLLFSIVMVFISYKSFNRLEGLQWSVLYWLLIIFSGVNAIMKSFVQESSDTRIYYYTIVNPFELLVAKFIYNYIFVLILSLLILGGFIFFFGHPIKDWSLFLACVSLGLMGITSVFTFISLLSSSGGSTSTLMSVLAFPLIIPSLLLIIKISAVATRQLADSSINNDMLLLVGVNCLLIGMTILLFEELWRE